MNEAEKSSKPTFDFDEYLEGLKVVSPGHEEGYAQSEDLQRQEFVNKINGLFGYVALGLITDVEQIKKAIGVIDQKHDNKFVEMRKETMKEFSDRIPQLEMILKEEESEKKNE